MLIAVSGSHSTGKSTLIGAFLDARPEYSYEPEAYETLADDVALAASEGPTEDGLELLLEFSVAAVGAAAPGARIVFERSPVDYLAYAAASGRSWPKGAASEFIRAHAPAVRDSVRSLDVIILLPVSRQGPITGRPDEDARFRKRVDDRLRRALIDDEYDLFAGTGTTVAELPPDPERQLRELVRLLDARKEQS
jgi:hypothetical protein